MPLIQDEQFVIIVPPPSFPRIDSIPFAFLPYKTQPRHKPHEEVLQVWAYPDTDISVDSKTILLIANTNIPLKRSNRAQCLMSPTQMLFALVIPV